MYENGCGAANVMRNWWRAIKKQLDAPWAAYTFAICVGVVLFLVLSHISFVWDAFKAFYHYISPVVIGIVIAYVLDPMVKFWENRVFYKMKRKAARGLGVVITMVLLILFVVILLVAMIPQLVSSVRMFIENLGSYVKSLNAMLAQLQAFAAEHNVDISGLTSSVEDMMGSLTDMLPRSLNGILNTTISYGVDIFNGIISTIIAVYILLGKDSLLAGLKRLWRALINENSYRRSYDFLGRCNEIMIQFILFDLLDGLIIGLTNAVFMLIAGYPYVPLISVIVGVTNLAPTFGPILGAVIGGLILLLINPLYALGFLIFTIILQTVDGYIIKPKLFGGKLGVQSIWILMALIVFGRVWGGVGILLAIPIAAILDYIIRDGVLVWLERRRSKRDAAAAAAKSITKDKKKE